MAIKNTFIDFQLDNDEIVKLTLTFGKLNLLKSVNNELYTRYMEIIYGKREDLLDMVTIIYVAYWCANFGKEGLRKEDDFIELVPFDMPEIQRAYNSLMRPKKK